MILMWFIRFSFDICQCQCQKNDRFGRLVDLFELKFIQDSDGLTNKRATSGWNLVDLSQPKT